jgi:hypothetical protein
MYPPAPLMASGLGTAFAPVDLTQDDGNGVKEYYCSSVVPVDPFKIFESNAGTVLPGGNGKRKRGEEGVEERGKRRRVDTPGLEEAYTPPVADDAPVNDGDEESAAVLRYVGGWLEEQRGQEQDGFAAENVVEVDSLRQEQHDVAAENVTEVAGPMQEQTLPSCRDTEECDASTLPSFGTEWAYNPDKFYDHFQPALHI